MCESINKTGNESIYIEEFEDIVKYLKDNLEEDDIIVTMGAGDVYKIGEMLIEEDK